VILEQLAPWTSGAAPAPEEGERVFAVNTEAIDEHQLTERRLEEVLDSLMGANERIVELNESLEALVAKRTEALHAAFAQTEVMLESMVDGLVSFDRDGRVQAVNPALSRLLVISEIEVGDLAGEVLPDSLRTLLERATVERASVNMEIDLPGDRIGAATASPIHRKDDDARSGGTVLTLRDVTVEKRIDQMKTNFTAAVSHELRTPLTSVLGFAKLTARKLEAHVFPHVTTENPKTTRAVETVRKNLGIITTEGTRLTALINDVLDISKMESGHVHWKRSTLDLPGLVRQSIEATSALFDERVELRSEISTELPAAVGDPDRVMQVVINLISNAAKFTDEGSVTVAVARTDGGVDISVTDTGAGIAEVDQASIFERFRQVGDTLGDKPKGTGLGLAICVQIAEAHGGAIRVESTPGEGSRFTFWLPEVGDTA